MEMANGVPEIQPAGPLPEPAGKVSLMGQERRASVTVSCLYMRAHYCMNVWIATFYLKLSLHQQGMGWDRGPSA